MLYLASKSPRRRELLEKLGVPFEVLEINIDETWNGKENPGDYVVRLALEKARDGRNSVREGDCVVAADTEVVLDNRVLGKPDDEEHAVRMLELLSGRTHHVLSAVAVIRDAEHWTLSTSSVSFKPITQEERREYCRSGEPQDKAGAYAIQGQAAAFITRLEGSFSGVMGLPLEETMELLRNVGINLKRTY